MKNFKIAILSSLILITLSCSDDSDDVPNNPPGSIFSIELTTSLDERYELNVFVSSGTVSVLDCNGQETSSFSDINYSFPECTITNVSQATVFQVNIDYVIAEEFALEEENFTTSNGFITAVVREDGDIIDTFDFTTIPNERPFLMQSYESENL